jgi:hypothetical protein
MPHGPNIESPLVDRSLLPHAARSNPGCAPGGRLFDPLKRKLVATKMRSIRVGTGEPSPRGDAVGPGRRLRPPAAGVRCPFSTGRSPAHALHTRLT